MKAKLRFVALLAAMSLLTGCNITETDPGLNLNGGLRTSLDSETRSELSGAVYNVPIGEGSAGNSNTGLNNPNGDVTDLTEGNTATDFGSGISYQGLAYDIVDYQSYKSYLDKAVYAPVYDILSVKGYKDIYFRVLWRGCQEVENTDKLGVSGDTVVKLAPVSIQSIQDCSVIGGLSIPKLMVDYLGASPLNTGKIEQAKESWEITVNNLQVVYGTKQKNETYPLDFQTGKAANDTDAKLLVQMWSNPRLWSGAEGTLQDYLDKVSKTVIGTVPNIKLAVSSSQGGTRSVTLNPSMTNAVNGYKDYVTVSDADNVMCGFPQYGRTYGLGEDKPKQLSYNDSQSVVHAFWDGSNFCIVVLACAPGTTLESELGKEGATKAVNAINSMSSYVNIAAVSKVVTNTHVIKSGTRGVD